jgi:putative transposase
VESFNARVRDELLNVEQFSCLAEATVVINDWRQDYNAHRPHSALANQTPDAFARAWWVRSAEPAMGIGIFS